MDTALNKKSPCKITVGLRRMNKDFDNYLVIVGVETPTYKLDIVDIIYKLKKTYLKYLDKIRFS